MTGLEALILAFGISTTAPVVSLEPEKFDTVTDRSLQFYGGVQSSNRDLRPGFEIGTKIEYLVTHPYMVRFGVDYSSARVTNNPSPAGHKYTWSFTADIIAYRGRYGTISYLGVGLLFTANNYNISSRTLDSLNAESGVTRVELNDKFGYRVFVGLRFHERFVIEASYQQANPDFVYTRRFEDGRYSEENVDGSFSVARMSFGYLLKI